MLNILKIGKLEIRYDAEALLKEVQAFGYDEESFDGKAEHCWSDDGLTGFEVSKEEFNRAKKDFCDKIRGYATNITTLEDDLRYIKTKKNGGLAKNRNYDFVDMGVPMDYNNSHGSHGYTMPVLRLQRISEFEAQIVFSRVSRQDSF